MAGNLTSASGSSPGGQRASPIDVEVAWSSPSAPTRTSCVTPSAVAGPRCESRRLRAGDARRRAGLHRRRLAPARRPRLDRPARARPTGRPRPGPGRPRGRDGGDGSRALPGPVLLVRGAGHARRRPARARRPAGLARHAAPPAARSPSTRRATATWSTGCAPAPAARPATGCSPASSRWCSTATRPTGCWWSRAPRRASAPSSSRLPTSSWCPPGTTPGRWPGSCCTTRRPCRSGPTATTPASGGASSTTPAWRCAPSWSGRWRPPRPSPSSTPRHGCSSIVRSPRSR